MDNFLGDGAEQSVDALLQQGRVLDMFVSGIGILDIDTEKSSIRRIYLNDGFFRMLGAARESHRQYEDADAAGALCREDLPAVWSEVKACIAEKRPGNARIRIRDGQGQYRWFAVAANHEALKENTERFYAAFSDIDALMKERQLLRANFEAAADSYREALLQMRGMQSKLFATACYNVTKDKYENLDSHYVSELLSQFEGSIPQEFLDIEPSLAEQTRQSALVLVAVAQQVPDAAKRAEILRHFCRAGCEKLFAAGIKSYTIEYRQWTKGRLLWVRTETTLAVEPGSGDLMAFTNSRDVNDELLTRRVSELAMSKNYESVAYYDVNAKILYDRPKNRTFEEGFLVRPYEETIEKSIDRNMPEAEKQRLEQLLSIETIQKELETKKVYSIYYDGKGLRKDIKGEPRRRIRLDIFYMDGNCDGIVYLQSDVTADIQQERAQREMVEHALNQAEQASNAKTEFLSRMSHEIRTPLNAIIGLDAIALQSKNLSAVMEDHLQKIGISARFLLSLINDILDMSRIESGKMLLNKEPFSFEELIDSLNTIFYEQCRANGLDYECILKSFTEETYVGDRTKLQQVLINILGNAVKFTPRGGKVHLAIEQLSRTKETAKLRFEIADTGIGISEEFLPHLFEPFSQENSARTTQYGGTGLGLAISKNVVSLMNGSIRVHSVKGIGSEFVVEVELGVPANVSAWSAIQEKAAITPLHTLIVDDDVVICQHTQMLLKEAGLKAESAQSGQEAIEKVKACHISKQDYDLILLDWKMPEMDGIETAREIRRIVGPEITIIIMTAYDWADIEERARAAGVDMFMKKPVFVSSVTRAFENVFSHRTETRPKPADNTFDFTGCRVLLAEDNLINAEIARNLLEMKGCAVETAENGAVAIEMFAASPAGYYNAILMDIRMPVMDGLEAARTIRAMKKADAQKIPILAMTANAFAEDVELSLKSGMNAHMAKPIEPNVLYGTLRKFVKN